MALKLMQGVVKVAREAHGSVSNVASFDEHAFHKAAVALGMHMRNHARETMEFTDADVIYRVSVLVETNKIEIDLQTQRDEACRREAYNDCIDVIQNAARLVEAVDNASEVLRNAAKVLARRRDRK